MDKTHGEISLKRERLEGSPIGSQSMRHSMSSQNAWRETHALQTGGGRFVMATILVIESYPNLASLYREILTEEGHHVLVASSWKEANDFSMTQEIDLVLIDEGLREGNENELIENLKTNQPQIKAILCSLTEFSPQTYRDLCDEGFLKTYDYTILLQKVADLSRKTSGRDLNGADITDVG
jgi:CheY-like chemotaxis protein